MESNFTLNFSLYIKVGDEWTDGPCKTVKCESVFNDCLNKDVAQILVTIEKCSPCEEVSIKEVVILSHGLHEIHFTQF